MSLFRKKNSFTFVQNSDGTHQVYKDGHPHSEKYPSRAALNADMERQIQSLTEDLRTLIAEHKK